MIFDVKVCVLASLKICKYLCKVHIFWEGHKILRNLHLTLDWHYTVMRFSDLKETSTDMAADWIFEKFKLI